MTREWLGDLHPDDCANRRRLREELIVARHSLGWTQEQAGVKSGLGASTWSGFEKNTNWSVRRVRAWAHGLNCTITFDTGPLFLEPADETLPILLAGARDEQRRWEVEMLHRLTVTRAVNGIELRAMAHATGGRLTKDTFWLFESMTRSTFLLSTLQRHVRLMGGVLGMSVGHNSEVVLADDCAY